ncbi:helix-turn-helix domain-containing protein [Streptomyces sp. NPDC029526]|uniref:helix-turn-helix domain-containing protein n=1 Tax=Streptomyces sp. NPDC029526 TaxID=3155728 RepID=UPI0034095A19
MWKRARRGGRPHRDTVPPVELCDLCAATFPADRAVHCLVPDSSCVQERGGRADGLRLLTACGEGHLEELREDYRRRPFVEEELWAAKVAQVLGTGPRALTVEELARRTGLHEPEIHRAVVWHNRRLREARDHPGP